MDAFSVGFTAIVIIAGPFAVLMGNWMRKRSDNRIAALNNAIEALRLGKFRFSVEPTARGDDIAYWMRLYYETYREDFNERRWKRWEYCADEFMLGFVNHLRMIDRLVEEQDKRDARNKDQPSLFTHS